MRTILILGALAVLATGGILLYVFWDDLTTTQERGLTEDQLLQIFVAEKTDLEAWSQLRDTYDLQDPRAYARYQERLSRIAADPIRWKAFLDRGAEQVLFIYTNPNQQPLSAE